MTCDGHMVKHLKILWNNPNNKSTWPNVKLLRYNKWPFAHRKVSSYHLTFSRTILIITMQNTTWNLIWHKIMSCAAQNWLSTNQTMLFPYCMERNLVFLTTLAKSECAGHHIVQEHGHVCCNTTCVLSKEHTDTHALSQKQVWELISRTCSLACVCKCRYPGKCRARTSLGTN